VVARPGAGSIPPGTRSGRPVTFAEVRSPLAQREAVDPPLIGELRYGLELARLTADPQFLRPRRPANAVPVLLIPGFMAGDSSLGVLGGWLGRRGSRTASAGLRLNIDCGARIVSAIEARLERLARRSGRPVVIVGQSRGGELGRVLAVRKPNLVSGLVMLGSPVLDPLSVGPAVLRAVRSVARLGDLGVPRMFSSECGDGECCAEFRADLAAPLPESIRAVAVYSRSDGIVSWRACLDPCAEHVEVGSSHCGMSVNGAVYRVLAEVLEDEERRWTG
jgi:pimeloyl-ACP methyl ester carboxylesterase